MGDSTGTVRSSPRTEAMQQREGLGGGGTQPSYSVGGGSWIDNTHHLNNTIFKCKKQICHYMQRNANTYTMLAVAGFQHQGLLT